MRLEPSEYRCFQQGFRRVWDPSMGEGHGDDALGIATGSYLVPNKLNGNYTLDKRTNCSGTHFLEPMV